MHAEITQVTVLPSNEFDVLLRESVAEGFRFLARLHAEWESGANRFDASGEALFVATAGAQLVGICGLNRDRCAGDPGIGRVRHLYVRKEYRRRGVGRQLVEQVIAHARRDFYSVALRTDTAEADAFYLALGFSRVRLGAHTTHRLSLR